MPIYEYRCGACGHELEVLQKLSEAPLSDCPQCHKPSLSKLISAVGFQLKGSGWYATDFKSSGKPAGKNGDAAAKSTEKSGESKSGESKGDSSESNSTATADTSNTSSSGGCGGGCSCH